MSVAFNVKDLISVLSDLFHIEDVGQDEQAITDIVFRICPITAKDLTWIFNDLFKLNRSKYNLNVLQKTFLVKRYFNIPVQLSQSVYWSIEVPTLHGVLERKGIISFENYKRLKRLSEDIEFDFYPKGPVSLKKKVDDIDFLTYHSSASFVDSSNIVLLDALNLFANQPQEEDDLSEFVRLKWVKFTSFHTGSEV